MNLTLDYRNRVTTLAQNYRLYVRSFFELYSYISGDGIYLCCIDNTLYELEPGDVILFRPDTLHSTYKNAAVRYERLYLCFDSELEQLMKNLDPAVYRYLTEGPLLVHPTGEDADRYRALIGRLCTYTEGRSARILAGTLELLEILARSPIKTAPAVKSGSDLTRRVIRYIAKHYATISGTAEIAREFNYSPKHLSSRFCREMGIGLNKFLQDYRLAAAEAKLLAGLGVTACTLECGFESSSYFISLFKKKFGLTPGVYREQKIGHN